MRDTKFGLTPIPFSAILYCKDVCRRGEMRVGDEGSAEEGRRPSVLAGVCYQRKNAEAGRKQDKWAM